MTDEKKPVLDLLAIRDEIDKTDRGLVDLYHKRMELVEEVARYKIATGKPVLDRAREEQKLDTLAGYAKDAFDETAIREVFRQLMAVSRKMQYGILTEVGMMEKIPFTQVEKLKTEGAKICYQGVEGAYSHAVTKQYFGTDADCYHVPSFEDVMKEVAEGKADYGVLPIENSSAGSVTDVYDLLEKYENVIVAEDYIKVNHGLLVLPGAELSDIKTVYSHPQGLMQCAGFLREHPQMKAQSLENTAVSAMKVVKDGDITQAAIASSTAAELYGLKVLVSPVNDNIHNTTRFVIVQKEPVYTEAAKKISIVFRLPHEAGSLYSILSHLMHNGLNMTMIESRPIPDKPFEYRFYVDIEGNLKDAAVQNALAGIRSEASTFQLLGNYETEV